VGYQQTRTPNVAIPVSVKRLGQGWHLLDSFTTNQGVVHGGGDIAGICTGDWCTDIDCNGVSLILAVSSCTGLTSSAVGHAEGIGTETECFFWSAGQCDCATLNPCMGAASRHGTLCSDW